MAEVSGAAAYKELKTPVNNIPQILSNFANTQIQFFGKIAEDNRLKAAKAIQDETDRRASNRKDADKNNIDTKDLTYAPTENAGNFDEVKVNAIQGFAKKHGELYSELVNLPKGNQVDRDKIIAKMSRNKAMLYQFKNDSLSIGKMISEFNNSDKISQLDKDKLGLMVGALQSGKGQVYNDEGMLTFSYEGLDANGKPVTLKGTTGQITSALSNAREEVSPMDIVDTIIKGIDTYDSTAKDGDRFITNSRLTSNGIKSINDHIDEVLSDDDTIATMSYLLLNDPKSKDKKMVNMRNEKDVEGARKALHKILYDRSIKELEGLKSINVSRSEEKPVKTFDDMFKVSSIDIASKEISRDNLGGFQLNDIKETDKEFSIPKNVKVKIGDVGGLINYNVEKFLGQNGKIFVYASVPNPKGKGEVQSYSRQIIPVTDGILDKIYTALNKTDEKTRNVIGSKIEFISNLKKSLIGEEKKVGKYDNF